MLPKFLIATLCVLGSMNIAEASASRVVLAEGCEAGPGFAGGIIQVNGYGKAVLLNGQPVRGYAVRFNRVENGAFVAEITAPGHWALVQCQSVRVLK